MRAGLPDRTIELLDEFDLVVVNFEGGVDGLRARLSHAKVLHLPLGIDALRFAPPPTPVPRGIDLFWLGRCEPEVNAALQDWAERKDRFFLFNSVFGEAVTDPRDHRRLLARRCQRTRLFATYPAKFNEPELTRDQPEIGFRYFEGAAAGATLIGKAPASPSFEVIFPWTAPVQPLPDGPAEIVDAIDDLLARGAELEAGSREGVLHCLRHHDWVYRIEAVLRELGLESHALEGPIPARKERLARRAAAFR
jgi:hypothetical protein